MRRILTVLLMSLLYVSLQAQLISFDTLKNGVIDVAKIKKELILNGFTKVTDSPKSNSETYNYNYDETEETASISVIITPLIELENAGLFSISVLTSGDYIHDELEKEISEKCTFEGLKNDALMYTCDYTTFIVSSQGGKRIIIAHPNYQQLPEEEMKEFLKAIEETKELL